MNGYELAHIYFRSMEDLACSMLYVKFQGPMGREIDDLVPIWSCTDDGSHLKSQMVMKWHA